MKNEIFETRTVKIWLGEDGILRMVGIKPNASVTLTEAKENFDACVKASKGKKRPLFVDIRQIKSVDRESRQYTAGEATAKFTYRVAILFGSPLSKFFGNLFLKLNNPLLPTKLFSSEDEAIEWLKGYME